MTDSLTNNNTIKQVNLPAISDKYIKCLKEIFPNQLPTTFINDFELGKLLGQQEVIEKMVADKYYNENEYKEDED